MKRREFIAGLLVAATLGHARAQQPAKVHRIAKGKPSRRLPGLESSLSDFKRGIATASSSKRRLIDWVFCYFPPGWKAPFRRQSIDVCSR